MKRPDLEVLFGPSVLPPDETVGRLLDLLLDDMDGYLSTYVARMAYDNDDDTYYFTDEAMTLTGRPDLLKRIEQHGSVRFSCDVNLGFYPATVSPAVFRDPPEGTHTTCVASIDSNLVLFLEESERPRAPAVTFITRIAAAIEADWFLAGLHLDHWRALSTTALSAPDPLPPATYIVAWREGAANPDDAARRLKVAPEQIKRTTLGFRFVTFFPEPEDQ